MKKKKSKALYPPTSKYEEDCPEESNPQTEQENKEDQETILALIASLHLNSDYSDLAIFCKGKVLSAHKLVVCPRSKYFQNACYSGFKETEHPIRLNEKDPILIEKVLEFLYTGSYTPPCFTQPSKITQANGEDIPEIDRQPAEEPSQEYQPENDATGEVDEHFTELVARTLENTPEALPRTNENPAAIEEFPPKFGSKERDKGDFTEQLVDSLVDCHPCYFHVRMYGEADYFMIDDLKSKAEVYFCASFMNSPETDSFAEIIDELYSTRANYHALRQLAIEMMVANLASLRNGPAPVITSALMKSIPDLTYDLLQATLDKYVREPPDVDGNRFHVDY